MWNFIKYSKQKNLSKNTINTYISSLKIMEVEKNNWLNTKKKLLNCNFSANTMHLHKTILLNFYKFKKDKAKLQKLEIIKLPQIEVKYYLALSKNHIYKKTSINENDSTIIKKWKTIILFLFETGIRASELNNLFLDNQRLFVIGKGKKRRQIFFIKNTLNAILQINKNLKHFETSKTLRLYIKKILGAKVTPHTLRRSFATHMLKKGCNPKSVMLQMGHSKIETTFRYLNLSEKYNHNNYLKYIDK